MDLRSARAAIVMFGRCVRVRRILAGMSQRELARRAKVRQPFVSQMECGRTNPSLETMVLVADALGCPIYELLMGEDVYASGGLSRRDVQRIADAVKEAITTSG